MDAARPGAQQGTFFTFSGNQVLNLQLGAKKILLYEALWLGWKITVGINSPRCQATKHGGLLEMAGALTDKQKVGRGDS